MIADDVNSSDTPLDLLVIGGGINGTGIACDAAGRGLSVCLCEQDDLAGATSSASSKLIHGGLRYLEQYEFRLVREALGEREVMLSKAAHIIKPMRFILPHHHQMRPAWLVRLGLFLYDHLAAHPRLANSEGVDLTRHAAGVPLKSGMDKGFAYADCWVDDARLVIFNAMQAADKGATILTRTKLVEARRENGLWRARLRDQQSGTEQTVRARVLVNAAGPWVKEVLDEALGASTDKSVVLVKGSHIVTPRLHEGSHAYILQNPDRRVVFVIPFQDDFSLIGTTDIPVEGDPGQPTIDEDEVRYLCDSANRYFEKQISAADVVWSYSGVRPLFNDGEVDPSAVTREYVLDLDAPPGEGPVLSIFGGKITTYRSLAEQVLDKLRPFFPDMTPAWTATTPLPGGDMPDADFDRFFAAVRDTWPALDEAILRGLARRHGVLIHQLLADIETVDDLGQSFGGGLYAREVDYFVAHEWARTAEDILWRRTKAGLYMDADQCAGLSEYLSAGLAAADR